ncbi:MAG TPA: WhiB family transcriptional regulator [Acidimicrobiales bacterium]|nr:WhiB family transcriptional regulator [Acidimicrobiales bacterium]
MADPRDRRRAVVGLLDLDATTWMRRASCRTAEPGALFPIEYAKQRQVVEHWCTGCPVRTECLEYALERNIDHGVWGATEKERRMLRRVRRMAQRAG